MKVRKPRGTKLDGYRSEDMCKHCCSLGCDPMSMSPKFKQMVRYRRDNNLCQACGANPCICKSSLETKPQLPICDVCGEYILGRAHYMFKCYKNGVKYTDTSILVHTKCINEGSV